MRLSKFAALGLAVYLTVAPFTALMTHIVSHFFVSDHHAHGEFVHHHHDDHDRDHPFISIYLPDVIPASLTHSAAAPLKAAAPIWIQLQESSSYLLSGNPFRDEKNIPPPQIFSPFLLSHPANAPPIR